MSVSTDRSGRYPKAAVQKRRDVRLIHEELEELFADLWQVPRFAGLRRGFRPHVDCYRTDDPPAVTVVVDLAGIDPEQRLDRGRPSAPY